ncbi:response regulator [Granulosicoccus sp.]|nr:response regulator [Granulosicoccus sp.]
MVTEPKSILVVDDDENQRWMLTKYLKKHGFTVTVADDGASMRKLLDKDSYDLILLDISMPGEDGFSIARYLREHHRVGIIMLTASRELFERVLGLEIGADDYITKPFEPRELLARVKSVLRRVESQQTYQSGNEHSMQNDLKENLKPRFGNCILDLTANKLIDQHGNGVDITAMELDLLKAFAENPGQVLSRDTLLTLAHKQDAGAFDRSIDIRVARVRRKIEPDPAKPSVIKTVRGVGYIYIGE